MPAKRNLSDDENFHHSIEYKYAADSVTDKVSVYTSGSEYISIRFVESIKGGTPHGVNTGLIWLGDDQVDELITVLQYWRQLRDRTD